METGWKTQMIVRGCRAWPTVPRCYGGGGMAVQTYLDELDKEFTEEKAPDTSNELCPEISLMKDQI
ncbi:hypothetical protein CDL15_Pgr018437 [Punica granatum]|uniref:Uncharacterized protein n=1 Tax=Punica granatum TaxID=22663 RepID=A0A218WZ76_PUNGR|nr:hypothetical protein CDL15_Pgr018437 [Punica granatum]